MDYLELAIKTVSANTRPPKTYTGEDGLLHCAECREPAQMRMELLGESRVFPRLCKCRRDALEAAERRERETVAAERRRKCFSGADLMAATFSADEPENEKLSEALKRYSSKFNSFRDRGEGLFLYGNKGAGKTFYAACIANEVITAGGTAFMRTFAELERDLQSGAVKPGFLNAVDLLVLDDLGAERSTEYMTEVVFTVIDGRIKSGKPMIVTSNFTKEEIKNPENRAADRILDRILGHCFPIEFTGRSRRKQRLKENFSSIKEELGL